MLHLTLPIDEFNSITDGRQTAMALTGLVVQTGSVLCLSADNEEDKRETYVIIKHCFSFRTACIASVRVSVSTDKASRPRMEAITISDKGDK